VRERAYWRGSCRIVALGDVGPGGAQARARCWLAETASDTDQARIRLRFPEGGEPPPLAGVAALPVCLMG
jgi:hypothetical protein